MVSRAPKGYVGHPDDLFKLRFSVSTHFFPSKCTDYKLISGGCMLTPSSDCTNGGGCVGSALSSFYLDSWNLLKFAKTLTKPL